jgi:hypothetical protein
MIDAVKCPDCDFEGISEHSVAIHRGMMHECEMAFIKICGCVVDYRPIQPPTGATVEPTVEVVTKYCDVHQPKPASEGASIP